MTPTRHVYSIARLSPDLPTRISHLYCWLPSVFNRSPLSFTVRLRCRKTSHSMCVKFFPGSSLSCSQNLPSVIWCEDIRSLTWTRPLVPVLTLGMRLITGPHTVYDIVRFQSILAIETFTTAALMWTFILVRLSQISREVWTMFKSCRLGYHLVPL
jgi:hypothetical protein